MTGIRGTIVSAILSLVLLIGPWAFAESQEKLSGDELVGKLESNFNQSKCADITAEHIKRVTISSRRFPRHGHILGKLFQSGCGVPQHYERAVYYYRLAASRGYVPAQTSLGSMFETGLGTGTKDAQIAKSWYHRAARQGDIDAQYRLGKIYIEEIEDTSNCEQNQKEKCLEAHKWLNLAAAHGHREARKKREEFAEQLTVSIVMEAQQRAGNWVPLRWQPIGSGFYVTANGHVLTNAHVVEGCNEVTIQAVGATPIVQAEIVRRSPPDDLALLKISDPPHSKLSCATFPKEGYVVRLGADVMVVGYPAPGIMLPVLAAEPNATTGNVSAIPGTDVQRRSDRFQITAPAQGGNSGGPVLNEWGNVVGVLVSGSPALGSELAQILTIGETGIEPGIAHITTRAENVNYAVSLSAVRKFLEDAGVQFTTDDETTDHKTPPTPVQVAEKARNITVMVDCWYLGLDSIP